MSKDVDDIVEHLKLKDRKNDKDNGKKVKCAYVKLEESRRVGHHKVVGRNPIKSSNRYYHFCVLENDKYNRRRRFRARSHAIANKFGVYIKDFRAGVFTGVSESPAGKYTFCYNSNNGVVVYKISDLASILAEKESEIREEREYLSRLKNIEKNNYGYSSMNKCVKKATNNCDIIRTSSSYTSKGDKVIFLEEGLPNGSKKTPIFTLDLHGFTKKEAKKSIKSFFYFCERYKIPKVRIVHGRSGNAIKSTVRELCNNKEGVRIELNALDESGQIVVIEKGDWSIWSKNEEVKSRIEKYENLSEENKSIREDIDTSLADIKNMLRNYKTISLDQSVRIHTK
jgi:hypothetical protein